MDRARPAPRTPLPATLAAAVPLGGETGRRFAEFDWDAHPLGPPRDWPPEYRTAVATTLTSRFPIVLWLGAADLYLVYNDAYAAIMGDKHPAALGRPGREVWWDIWTEISPMLAGVVETGEATWSNDLMLALVTGGRAQERYFTFSYSPLLAGSGDVHGIFCAVTETTDRVLGERRLSVLNAVAAGIMEMRSIGDAVEAAVAICAQDAADLPFVAVYAEDSPGTDPVLRGATASVLGLLPRELRGLTDRRAAAGVRTVWEVPHLSAVIPGLATVFGETPPERALVLPVGEEPAAGVLVIGTSPRRPLDEQYRAFCQLLADQLSSAFSAIASYEQQRRRADDLAEIDRAKTAFLSNVSHEFRTPLTLLAGPVDDALAAANGDAALIEQLNMVRRNAGRLRRLVDALLDFSRVEAGRAQADPVRTDAGAYTAHLASSFAELCERAGLRLILDCESVQADLDPAMWETIVLNLLSNAVKFTFTGSITVSVRAVPEGCRICVRDTGIGIAEAELGRVFERFHRGDNTRGRTVEGAGVGLALVRGLVELHHGTIRVESRVDVGTSVIIVVPVADSPSRVPVVAPTRDGRNPYVEEAGQWVVARHVPPDAAPAVSAETAPDARPETSREVVPDARPEASREVVPDARPEASREVVPDARPEASREVVPDARPEASREVVHGARPETAREVAPEAGRASALGEGGASGLPALPRKLVLVADDNADMRAYLHRILVQRWDIALAADGRSALRMARARRPDLIVTDVMMPELDGFGLVAALRADPRLRAVPVVMLSARAGAEAAGEGYAGGADDYLAKPFGSRELVDRVAARLAAVERERAQWRAQASAETDASAVARLDAALRATDSAREILDAVLVHHPASAGAPTAAIGVIDTGKSCVRIQFADTAQPGVAPPRRTLALDAESALAEAIRCGAPIIVRDNAVEDSGGRRGEAPPGARSGVIHPLRDPDYRMIGVLARWWSCPREFPAAELRLLAESAELVQAALHRILVQRRERRIALEFQDQLLDLDSAATSAVVAAVYQPAEEGMRVGGDWYQATPLDRAGRVGISVGDVVGHGLSAAVVMSRLRAAIGSAALTTPDPGAVIEMVSQYATTVRGAHCATVAYAVLDPATGVVEYCCAGHPYPLLIPADGPPIYLDDGRRPPLGISGWRGATRSGGHALPPGSTVLLYTDGLIERPGESLDEGFARLRAAAAAAATLPTAALTAELLERLRPPGGYTDDVVLLALRPVGTTADTFTLAVPAAAGQLPVVRTRMREWLARHGIPARRSYDILLAVGEALSNAIEHGSDLDPAKTVSVEAARHAAGIIATVTDSGSDRPRPGHSSTGRGRGLTLMNGLADQVESTRSLHGTCVTLRFDLGAGAGAVR
ncbi:SpoIIE family protein phosphatase [Nocardia sp. 2]|uniref:histidine kinase n=1 Tax=Nocardia acididurans TaxID=2802282 RepID=A0ABS1M773_9NOCA|nr:SpoIIE family protein phosphatase [Nocardia acididurans]MBL1076394.1 SpoIIE family protein phosphatase [Nocardia acididurans]